MLEQHLEKLRSFYVAVQENSIEEHLRKSALPFACLYSVESFTLTRSFVLENVCAGILPLSMARHYLATGRTQHFPVPSKPNYYFGEHRVCATTLESTKDDPKIKAIFAHLETHAVEHVPKS